MYNYFTKKDPEGGPAYMAWIAISIFTALFLLNIIGVSSIILSKEILPSSGKDDKILISVILFGFIYFLLFYVMKLKNLGEKDEIYTITRDITRTTWAVYTLNVLFFIVIVLVKKIYFGI